MDDMTKDIDWIFDALIWILIILGSLALWWLSWSGKRGEANKGRPERRKFAGSPCGATCCPGR